MTTGEYLSAHAALNDVAGFDTDNTLGLFIRNGMPPPPPMPVAVMYPPQRQLAPRVRVFVDWVVEKLKPMEPASAVPRPGVHS